MKKFVSIIICLCLLGGVFTSCGKNPTQTEKKLNIVTTIFPEYDWVKNILGEKADSADLTMLLDSGVDLHNYQPTADDIIKITTCDMFIYVGGESDKWVDDVLKNSENLKTVVIDLFEVLKNNMKEEEIKEGMQSHEEESENEGEEEIEYDEHVWLSLKNAKVACEYISQKLCEIDSSNSEVYTNNVKAYTEKFDELDKQYAQTVESAKNKTLIFADRFPFRYLTDDYSLDYYAAFVGCSAETEASFETISFLAKKVDELSLDCVMTLEGSDQKIAQTVVKTTNTKNQKILSLDSMQSTTAQQVKEGADYLSIMTSNLDVLKEALN